MTAAVLHPSGSSGASNFLRKLLATSLVLLEDFEVLEPATRQALEECADDDRLLTLLVDAGLLTDYQAGRISAGATFGLILGNYRILNRIGAGGMGIVYKAEHLEMRRLVAIKVLPLIDQDRTLLARFLSEMRAVARLQHPHIVAALDAGKLSGPDPDQPQLRYLVMEYVPGRDLEDQVRDYGPLPVTQACEVIYQVASALAEAHKHQLVHRDIKPSNVRLTPEGQAKLLDFGLARHFRGRHVTDPGALLGTVDYMAPEQVRDPSGVDIRADIYALGGTLFWCLTGKHPFASQGNVVQDVLQRLAIPPPSVRTHRPEVSIELDRVVAKMMAINPDDRYPAPAAVMQALLPFVRPASSTSVPPLLAAAATSATPAPSAVRIWRVLVVDDEPSIRDLCRYLLQGEFSLEEAGNGAEALDVIRREKYDLVLLDVDMPQMTGVQVLQQLRQNPPRPNLKIIMISGRASADEMAQMLQAGADDYLTKPISLIQLQSRVRAALRLKDAQDRTDALTRHLLAVNSVLEKNLSARDVDYLAARNGLVFSLARLVEQRGSEAGNHLRRLQRYARCLAEEAAALPQFARQITADFICMLECCAPLHDVGKAGLPDHILLKPGKLAADERLLMQTHTLIGAEAIEDAARQNQAALAFFQMAVDIVRHHHERWDGTGYPDRLAGEAIPLSARILHLCDVYDALRSRRVYKPPLAHATAVQMIAEGSPGQFDPALVQAFLRCHPRFEQIYRELGD
jgi:response regulator RpfG family c-di-GMP phosphodiesterase